MAQEPVQIKEHIDAERERLGQDLEEIEHRMKDAVDWRSWYESNTMLMLGAAVAGGLLISMLVDRDRESHDDGYGSDRYSSAAVQTLRSRPKNAQLSRIGEVLENTVAALVGVGAAKLQDVVADAVPGFREKYKEAQQQAHPSLQV